MTAIPDATERALLRGRQVFGEGWSPVLKSRAPGRLELLGNHIDYNGGPVLAAAIDREVACLLARGDTPGITVLFPDISPEPERLDPSTLADWTNPHESLTSIDYVRGVIATGLNHGAPIRDGTQLSIAGDVPIGFGLSSSAALCIALTLALYDPAPTGRDLVLHAQEAEHRAGTPCGTMDQSASAGGNVILFDGASTTWESISPDLEGYSFVVADSGVARSLATSSYGRRVEESRRALAAANALLRTSYAELAEISLQELAAIESAAFDDLLFKRMRHVVTETARVRHGIEAMAASDWPRFGALMNESGLSSATDYEISHPAVEEIVEIARHVPGVAGARMMGGGEGGTALILAEQGAERALKERLFARFYASRSMLPMSSVKVFGFAGGASVGPV